MNYLRNTWIMVIGLSINLYGGDLKLQEGTRYVRMPDETLSEKFGSLNINLNTNYRFYHINNTKFFPKSNKYDLDYQTYLGYILSGSFDYKNYFKFPFYYITSIGDEDAINKVSDGFGGNGAYQSMLGLGSLINIGDNDLYLGYKKELFNTPITFSESVNYNFKNFNPNNYVLTEKSEFYQMGLNRVISKPNIFEHNIKIYLEYIDKDKFAFNNNLNSITDVDLELYGIGFESTLNLDVNKSSFLKNDYLKMEFHMGYGNISGNPNTRHHEAFYAMLNTEYTAYLNRYMSIGLNDGYELIDSRGKYNTIIGGVALPTIFLGTLYIMTTEKKTHYTQNMDDYAYLMPIFNYAFSRAVNAIFKQHKNAFEAKDFIGANFVIRY